MRKVANFLYSICVYIFLGCLFTYTLKAVADEQAIDTLDWQIQPKVCIVEKRQANCRFMLSITPLLSERLLSQSIDSTQDYCVYVNDDKLACFVLRAQPQDNTEKNINAIVLTLLEQSRLYGSSAQISPNGTAVELTLNIQQGTNIYLIDDQNNQVVSETLSIKARTKKTRRVREPWSLF